jgi:hypothetical protein
MRPAQKLGLSVALFLGLLVLGAWPSTSVELAFSAAYCRCANLVLDQVTFGGRGHAHLNALSSIDRRATDNVTADAVLALSVDHYRGSLPLGISLRRDVYLPLLIVLALIAAVPLPVRQRLTCLPIAAGVTMVAGIAANALVAAWTFSVELKGIYAPGSTATALRSFAYSALLLPPGNRFVAPLVLGLGLVAWVSGVRRLGRRAAARDVAPAADDDERRARDDHQDHDAHDQAAVALRAPR